MFITHPTFQGKNLSIEASEGTAYQVKPYDYYVNEYFLAKGLIYVLPYIADEILFSVALDEAAFMFKLDRDELAAKAKHIKESSNDIPELGTPIL